MSEYDEKEFDLTKYPEAYQALAQKSINHITFVDSIFLPKCTIKRRNDNNHLEKELDRCNNVDYIAKFLDENTTTFSFRFSNCCNHENQHAKCDEFCYAPINKIAYFFSKSVRTKTDDGSVNSEFQKDLKSHLSRCHFGIYGTYVRRPGKLELISVDCYKYDSYRTIMQSVFGQNPVIPESFYRKTNGGSCVYIPFSWLNSIDPYFLSRSYRCWKKDGLRDLSWGTERRWKDLLNEYDTMERKRVGNA